MTESMLARVHFVVPTRPIRPRHRRRPARRGTGRRDPAVGRRLPAGAGTQAR
ncbi:hypothetical protein V2I01_06230 [Micromonospora sp. BRA006-A]|nr:hypothetical protein [Micromonospora sp. BRA006-A]